MAIKTLFADSLVASPGGDRNTRGPHDTNPTDDSAFEFGLTLGVRINTTAAGQFNAIRFWRDPAHNWTRRDPPAVYAGIANNDDVGPTIASLWKVTTVASHLGPQVVTLEAAQHFPDLADTDTGWVKCELEYPIPASSGESYIAAVLTRQYSASNSFFGTSLGNYGGAPWAIGSPPTYSPYNPNGVFLYMSGAASWTEVPTNGHIATNYFVDVEYEV